MRLPIPLLVLPLGVLLGCAQVSVRDGRGARTGFVFYDPMPCLLVKRHADTGEVLDATVLTLPNRARPHYVVHRPGLGVATFAAETENGVLTKFTHGAKAEAQEPLKEASEGFRAIAEELLKVEKGKKTLEAELAERAAERAAAATANEEIAELENAFRASRDVLGPRAVERMGADDPVGKLEARLVELRKCLDTGTRPSDCGLAEFVRALQRFEATMCQPAPDPDTQKPLKAWCDAVSKAIAALSALCAPVAGDGADGKVPFEYEVYEIHVQDGHVTGLTPLPMDVVDASVLTPPCGSAPPVPAAQGPVVGGPPAPRVRPAASPAPRSP